MNLFCASHDFIINEMNNIHNEIAYKSDIEAWNKEYWQSPDTTLILKTGDCEDFAILMMDNIYKKYLTQSFLLIIYSPELRQNGNPYHALVMINDQIYDPTLNIIPDYNFVILNKYSYNEVIKIIPLQ